MSLTKYEQAEALIVGLAKLQGTKKTDIPPFSIVLDDCPNVFIVPAIMTKNSIPDDSDLKVGDIEYQVSDNVPGVRNNSWDCLTFKEAVLNAKAMQKKINKKTR